MTSCTLTLLGALQILHTGRRVPKMGRCISCQWLLHSSLQSLLTPYARCVLRCVSPFHKGKNRRSVGELDHVT